MQVNVSSLSKAQSTCYFINLHNLFALYIHARFHPPASANDRRALLDNVTIFTNAKDYTLVELEREALSGSLSFLSPAE